MHKKYGALAGLLAVLIAGGAISMDRPGSAPNVAEAAASTPVPSSGPRGRPLGTEVPHPAADAPHGPAGIPAISRRLAATDAATPAFSADDAKAFIEAHGVAGVRFEPTGPATIQSVEFLTERDVHARFGEGTGLPDDTLLCLVTVQGTFTVSGPSVPGQAPRTAIAHMAYQVFDAHTGNRLMQGTGPLSKA